METNNIANTYQVCPNICIRADNVCDVEMYVSYNDMYDNSGSSTLVVKQTLSVGYNEVSWVDCIDTSSLLGEVITVSIMLSTTSSVSIVGSGTRLIVIALSSDDFRHNPEPTYVVDVDFKMIVTTNSIPEPEPEPEPTLRKVASLTSGVIITNDSGV